MKITLRVQLLVENPTNFLLFLTNLVVVMERKDVIESIVVVIDSTVVIENIVVVFLCRISRRMPFIMFFILYPFI